MSRFLTYQSPDRAHPQIIKVAYALPWIERNRLKLDGSWSYVGKRFADLANSNPSPSRTFSEFAAGPSYRTPAHYTFRVQASNLLNSAGLMEGDQRTSQVVQDLSNTYFNARAVFPRSIVASVSHQF